MAWRDSHYIKAYDLARTGLADEKIADAMDVTNQTLVNWKKKRPALQEAITLGRAMYSSPKSATEKFFDYVHGRIPDHLQKIWDEVLGNFDHPNGITRVEALFKDKGRRARQHLFLHALVHYSFNPSEACRAIAISKEVLDYWKEHDADFAGLLDEIHWHKRNYLASFLFNRCMAGDTAAIIFANKSLNPEEYGDRSKLTIDGSLTHKHEHVVRLEDSGIPIELQEQLLEQMRAKQLKVIDAPIPAKELTNDSH